MTSSKSSIIIKPGEILETFDKSESRLLSEKWLSTFGENRIGVNTNSFMWHIFSGGRFPSLSGEEALAAYKAQEAVEYIVLSNDRSKAVSTTTKPDSCDLRDYYVFPKNMAWTLAITHEDGWLGPYFAFHKDYKSLNQVNVSEIQARLLKLKELAIAKSKGWA